MTEIDEHTDQRGEQQTAEVEVSADREPTAPEVLEWRRDDVLLPEAEANTEEFPSLRNISAGFIFGGVVRPLEPAPPEYVTLSMRPASDREFVALAQWNMLWEAAQFRRRFFDLDDLPEPGCRSSCGLTLLSRTGAGRLPTLADQCDHDEITISTRHADTPRRFLTSG